MKCRPVVLIILILMVGVSILTAEEGMYPISEIHNLDLPAKGFEISADKIINPEGISLIDGIVNISGCTGSFVSDQGLILTNHHCAYRGAQAASNTEHDYIRDGFFAPKLVDEIPARGYTVRITDSYRDVSQKVLSAIRPEMSSGERTKAIEKKMKELVRETEKTYPGKRAEVSEMFPGKSYYLFIYTYLKDVRLVYVPPRSIGEFGGEEDNWVWPRHTGDFSFMRAYVAPDGSPAEYAPENVPYQPRRVVQVAPEGVSEEDFVFILGYPGRTYRHRTSHYLKYEQNFRLPFVADWYAWQIDKMLEIGKENRAVAIKHLSRIKSLSNTMKNYRGKLLGLRRLNLVAKKQKEEQRLSQFIQADADRTAAFGDLLPGIGRVYQEIRATADRDLLLDYLRRSPYILYFAYNIYQHALEKEKPDLERESIFMDRNIRRTRKWMELRLNNYYEPTDRLILRELFLRASKLPAGMRIKPLDLALGENAGPADIDRFLDNSFHSSILNNPDTVLHYFDMPLNRLQQSDDPFLKLMAALHPAYDELKEARKRRKGLLDDYYAKLLDIKQAYQKQDFIPDANGTLRLTFGGVRGYSPADGIYYRPFTTVKGVIEKTTGIEPFDTPEKLIRLHQRADFGRFANKKLGDVPVALLYDMDTTGGNSGSPVFNARGQLVGVNFDRAYEATINDYAWSEDYSRSIGVDIRYVLWVTEKFGGAHRLLQEMGIN